ncbi:MAG TPA: DUF924 family protein [Burkholderiales bacterium]|jgi:uncharacterized protein (DUF924 family)|nr:DUF924 family protein [Burkholderiales bacterium]
MAAASWDEVLEFWFGAPDSPEFGRPRAAWFTKSASFDALVRDRFLATHEAAASGALDAWAARPLAALALAVVLDQLPRNMFRGTPRAFAADARALAVARSVVAQGYDEVLLPVQRWFAYLPFEHAEDLAAQRESLRLFGGLAGDASGAGTLTYAMLHYAVIERFGRFPHRNAILGRESTPAELAFLAQPGSSF